MASFHQFAPYVRKINSLMRAIRKMALPREFHWTKPADILVKQEFLNGRTVNALNITLTPSGCEWATHAGCTMCGEFSGSLFGQGVSPEFHVAQAATAIAEFVPTEKAAWVRLYNEGSWTNPKEIDPRASRYIIRLTSFIKGIERITIETMAKEINRDRLDFLRASIASPVELEIGIGFEAKDDIVRNVLINKGETLKQVKEAVSLIREYGFRSLAYVLIKPPFLTEREAIEEATETVKCAFELGFDAVSVEPVSVHEYSLVEMLFMEGLWTPPWLWSVFAVAQATAHLGELRIGGLEYYPRPEIIAHNRHDGSDCTSFGWKAISAYNATHNSSFLYLPNCECKKQWLEELDREAAALLERLQVLNRLSMEKYRARKTKKEEDRA